MDDLERQIRDLRNGCISDDLAWVLQQLLQRVKALEEASKEKTNG